MFDFAFNLPVNRLEVVLVEPFGLVDGRDEALDWVAGDPFGDFFLGAVVLLVEDGVALLAVGAGLDEGGAFAAAGARFGAFSLGVGVGEWRLWWSGGEVGVYTSRKRSIMMARGLGRRVAPSGAGPGGPELFEGGAGDGGEGVEVGEVGEGEVGVGEGGADVGLGRPWRAGGEGGSWTGGWSGFSMVRCMVVWGPSVSKRRWRVKSGSCSVTGVRQRVWKACCELRSKTKTPPGRRWAATRLKVSVRSAGSSRWLRLA